jgi:hypothetical protein
MSFACSSSLVRMCTIMTRRRIFISEKPNQLAVVVAGNPFGYEILLDHFDKSSCLTVLRKQTVWLILQDRSWSSPQLINALPLAHVLLLLLCVLIEFFTLSLDIPVAPIAFMVYRSTHTISVASTVCKISIVCCTSA